MTPEERFDRICANLGMPCKFVISRDDTLKLFFMSGYSWGSADTEERLKCAKPTQAEKVIDTAE